MDALRPAILESLREREQTVSEIIASTGLSQSSVSSHLACLRDCVLVTAEQRGRYIAYRLNDDRVDTLLGLAEAFLADVACGVYKMHTLRHA